MPSASVSTAAMVNPGWRLSTRAAYRRSRQRSPNHCCFGSPATIGGRVADCRSGRMYLARRSGPCKSSSAAVRAAVSESPWPRSSRYRSSRCKESSSMISSSRAGARASADRRWRSAVVHLVVEGLVGSGMFSSRDARDGLDEDLPRGALGCEYAAALRGQPVEAPAPFAGFFHPGAENPAAFLEAIEQGIQRRDVELELAAGPGLDEFGDFVP